MMGIYSDSRCVTGRDPLIFLSVFFFLWSSDVDECNNDDTCVRGQCINTDGSFLCLCEAGFKFSVDTSDCEGKAS